MSKQDAVTSSLSDFFQKLILPTIINGPAAPPSILDSEPSPMTPLWQEPERFPSFQDVTCIEGIAQEVQTFFAARRNSENLVSLLETLSLPIHAPIAMRPPEVDTVFRDFNPLIINGINDFMTFLHRFIFRSIHQILRVLDQLHDWSFTTINHVSSDVIVNPIVLHNRGASIPKSNSVSLVILPFVPWEFTEKDFIDLSVCNRVLDYRESDWVTKSDRIWAYLYDICSNLNCYFFVITSYQRWCFGYFMPDWSEIYFSEPLNFDNSHVSIIGALVFWIESSFEDFKIREKSPGKIEPTPVVEVDECYSRCDLPDPRSGSNRQLHEKVLQLASSQVWRWVQLPIGRRHYRFGVMHNHGRHNHELRRINDQLHSRENKKRYAEIKKRVRKAKEVQRAKKIEEEEMKKVEVTMMETEQTKQSSLVEETDLINRPLTIMVEKGKSHHGEMEDVDIKDISDSESEAESDIDLLYSKKDDEYYDDWRTKVAEARSPNEVRLFVSGEYTAMYYGDEPEEFKKHFDFQVECVKDALLGNLDYGTPD